MPISKIGSKGVKDAELTADDIAPGTITSAKIAPGTIANDRLANNTTTINGTSIALGASGSIVAGTDWQSVKTSNFTAVASEGYFVNTSGGAITMTLPASPSAGDEVSIVDYAGTFGTNSVTVARNGSNIQGVASDIALGVDRRSTTFVYADATKGWLPENDNTGAQYASNYTNATGGTETTSGDFKIHTFNSSSNFVVTGVGAPSGGGAVASYMVVAGGGGGGSIRGGGGGAGGFREGRASGDSYTVSPLNAPAGITLTAQTYPITVGAGGAGQTTGVSNSYGGKGGDSVFATITSAGGGGGSDDDTPNSPGGRNGGSGGGSGGGANSNNTAGSGNTPPVSPPQGNNGGAATSPDGQGNQGSGGGGATEIGYDNNSPPGARDGDGGAGATTHITASPVIYAGGGSAGAVPGRPAGTAGPGGGGTGGGVGSAGGTGTTNKGGGGGGGGGTANGGAGGSGIVVIRYKYQN